MAVRFTRATIPQGDGVAAGGVLTDYSKAGALGVRRRGARRARDLSAWVAAKDATVSTTGASRAREHDGGYPYASGPVAVRPKAT